MACAGAWLDYAAVLQAGPTRTNQALTQIHRPPIFGRGTNSMAPSMRASQREKRAKEMSVTETGPHRRVWTIESDELAEMEAAQNSASTNRFQGPWQKYTTNGVANQFRGKMQGRKR